MSHLPSSFPMLSMIWFGISLWGNIPLRDISWGQLSWLCPSQSLCIPSPLTCGMRSRKALTLCKLCSAMTKISLYCQPPFEIQTSYCEINTPAQTIMIIKLCEFSPRLTVFNKLVTITNWSKFTVSLIYEPWKNMMDGNNRLQLLLPKLLVFSQPVRKGEKEKNAN